MKFFDNIMRAIGLKEEEDNEFEFDDEKKGQCRAYVWHQKLWQRKSSRL